MRSQAALSLLVGVVLMAACGAEDSTGGSLPGVASTTSGSVPNPPAPSTVEEYFGGMPEPGSVVANPEELCVNPGAVADFTITNPTHAPTGFSYSAVLSGEGRQYVVGLWVERPRLYEVPEGAQPTLPPQGLNLLAAGGSTMLAILAPDETGDYTFAPSSGSAPILLHVSTDCVAAPASTAT